MANTRGEKELKTNWPIVEGTTAGTTKQTGARTLHPEKSLVREIDKKGIY